VKRLHALRVPRMKIQSIHDELSFSAKYSKYADGTFPCEGARQPQFVNCEIQVMEWTANMPNAVSFHTEECNMLSCWTESRSKLHCDVNLQGEGPLVGSMQGLRSHLRIPILLTPCNYSGFHRSKALLFSYP